ncbi:hypothetical protein MUP65_00220, partial [Patescibacteria group bacterium]|nr:hypothetical protein [Patescibacteria group bacterium]
VDPTPVLLHIHPNSRLFISSRALSPDDVFDIDVRRGNKMCVAFDGPQVYAAIKGPENERGFVKREYRRLAKKANAMLPSLRKKKGFGKRVTASDTTNACHTFNFEHFPDYAFYTGIVTRKSGFILRRLSTFARPSGTGISFHSFDRNDEKLSQGIYSDLGKIYLPC